MNEHERRKAAEDLVDAVKNNKNNAFDRWLDLKEDDHEGHVAWVRDSLGLDQDPSKEDLQAMCDHSKEHLRDKIEELKTLGPRVPAVGAFCDAKSS